MEALGTLARSMHAYLGMQVAAGADVVQLFDSWAGLLDRSSFDRFAIPAARSTLNDLGVPTIYFSPGSGHTLDLQSAVAADGYGVDWRIPIDEAWAHLGDTAIQGNVDPSTLLASPTVIERTVEDLLTRVGDRPGHIVNLGHGIDRHTPPEHVSVFVDSVRSFRRSIDPIHR
jgi:uroporphyrinogen decarboxylase